MLNPVAMTAFQSLSVFRRRTEIPSKNSLFDVLDISLFGLSGIASSCWWNLLLSGIESRFDSPARCAVSCHLFLGRGVCFLCLRLPSLEVHC